MIRVTSTGCRASLGRSLAGYLLLLPGFFLPLRGTRAAPGDLETIYSEGKVDVFRQPGREDNPKLGPRGGRRAIARGDVVATDRASKVAVGIGGHTVVKAAPETVFAVLPASLENGKSRRRVEVIFVFLGEVKATTSWRKAPKGLRVKVSSEAEVASTDLGPVTIRKAAPPSPEVEAGEEGTPRIVVNVEKALGLSKTALPFTEELFAPRPPPGRVAELRAILGARRQPQPAKKSGKNPGGTRKKAARPRGGRDG